MLLYRIAPEGLLVAVDGDGRARILYSDPFDTNVEAWEYGRTVEDPRLAPLLPPVSPGKIVGVGRNYAAHARELDNPIPTEPLLFLKAPSSVIGPRCPIILPPESERVDFEGEIAVVIGTTISRGQRRPLEEAVLGVTCACDTTARDLQKMDRTFARAKSFDTFCPLGPAISVQPDFEALTVSTTVNGDQRQSAPVGDMLFSIEDLLHFISNIMTLEPGDIVLTGTPEGVGPLRDGDQLVVEVAGVGQLESSVESWQGQ